MNDGSFINFASFNSQSHSLPWDPHTSPARLKNTSWMMRQAWLARRTVELLLQPYWNLMETWPSKTSTWGINFHASWTLAQCSHYSNRLETNETIKKCGDEVASTAYSACRHNVFLWSRGWALLWAYYSSKQAIILSATWLTCSWCRVFASSLRGFFFQQVFRELEEITGAEANKVWYNTGTLSSGSVTLRWNS